MPRIIETIIRVRGDVEVGGLGNLGGSLGRASQGTQRLGDNLRRLSPALQALGGGVNGSDRTLSQLNSTLVSGAASVFAFSGAVQVASSVLENFGNLQLVLDRIDLFSDGTVKATDRLDQLFAMSQNNSAPLQIVSDLFVKMSRAMGEVEDSGGKALLVTDTLTKLMRISGTSSQEASAGLLQFAQGLSSASLSGDELKSVTENLPALAQILTKSLDVSIKGLKTLGADGLLTKDIIINAIIDGKEAVDAQAEALSQTFAQALIDVANAFNFYIFKSKEVGSINEFAIATLNDLAENMKSLIDQVLLAGKVLAIAFGPAIIRALIGLTAGLVNMIAASLGAGASFNAIRAGVISVAVEERKLAQENVRKAITDRRAAEAAVLHARANRAVGLSSVAEARALAALDVAIKKTTLATQDLVLANSRLAQARGIGTAFGAAANKALGFAAVLGLVAVAADELGKRAFGVEGTLSAVGEAIGSIFTALIDTGAASDLVLNSAVLSLSGDFEQAGRDFEKAGERFDEAVDALTSPLKSLTPLYTEAREAQLNFQESNEKLPKSLESVIKSSDKLSKSIKSLSDAQIKRVLDPNAIAELKADLKAGGDLVEQLTDKFVRSINDQTDLVTKQFEDRKALGQRVLESMAGDEDNLRKSVQKTFRKTLTTLIGVNNDRVKHHEKTLGEIIRFENVLKAESEKLIKDVARAAERAAGIRTGALDRLADAEKRHLENILSSEDADLAAKAAARSRLDALAEETGRTYDQVEGGLDSLLERIRNLSSSASELGATAAQAEFEALTSEFKDLDSTLGEVISDSFDVDKAKPLADQINAIGEALAATADDIAQVATVERDNGLEQLERSADGLRQTISKTKEDTEQLGKRLQKNLKGSLEIERQDLETAIAETVRLKARLDNLAGKVVVDTSELDALEQRLDTPLLQQVVVGVDQASGFTNTASSGKELNKFKVSATQARREVRRLGDEATRLSKVVKNGLKGQIKVDRKQLDEAVKTSASVSDALKNIKGAIFLDTSQLDELRQRVAIPLRQQVIIDTINGSGGTQDNPAADNSFIGDDGVLNRPGGFSLAAGDRLGSSVRDSSAGGGFSFAAGDRLKQLVSDSLDEADAVIDRRTPFDINAIIILEALEAQDELDSFISKARRSLLDLAFDFDFDTFVDEFKQTLNGQAGVISNAVAQSGQTIRRGIDLYRSGLRAFQTGAATIQAATEQLQAGFKNNVRDLAAANSTAISRIVGEADRDIREILQRTGEATKAAIAASERNVEGIIDAYKKSIRSISDTSESFLRSVDDLERNLRQVGSTDEEIRVDNIRRLQTALADARRAAAEGDIEEARRLADLAVELVSEISRETVDSFGHVVLSETEAAEQGLQFIDDIRTLNGVIDQEAIAAEQTQTQTELDNEQAVLDETLGNLQAEAEAEIAAINAVRETRLLAQSIAHDQALTHIQEQRDAALASIQAQVAASQGIQRPGGGSASPGVRTSTNAPGNQQGPEGSERDPFFINFGSPSTAFDAIGTGREVFTPRPTTFSQILAGQNPTNAGPTAIDNAVSFYNRGVRDGSTPASDGLAFFNSQPDFKILEGSLSTLSDTITSTQSTLSDTITSAGSEILQGFDALTGAQSQNTGQIEQFLDGTLALPEQQGLTSHEVVNQLQALQDSGQQLSDEFMNQVSQTMDGHLASVNGVIVSYDQALATILQELEPLKPQPLPTPEQLFAASTAAADQGILIKFQSGEDEPVSGFFPDSDTANRFVSSLNQNNRLARG